MPTSIREQAKVTGVELDLVTAAIAKHLYPSAAIINKGFQEVAIPDGYFDIVVGNPPFGNQRLYDANHPELNDFSIHNYFIAKSLDTVRDGGMVAIVVSNFFLDAHNTAARKFVAERAHLVGAIRLPNDTFKKNALTEVTTDIVFLQKARSGETPDKSWVDVDSVHDEATGEEIPLNNYFIAHPDMMLGKMALQGTMYRTNQPTLVAAPGQNLSEALVAAVTKLPAGIYTPNIEKNLAPEPIKPKINIPDHVKVCAYFIAEGGRLARRLPDLLGNPKYEDVEAKSEKIGERIKGMVNICDALRELMQTEQSEFTTDDDLAIRRAILNREYNAFVKQHGFISSQINRSAMKDDPNYPLLSALERNYDKGISKEMAARNGVEPRVPSANKAAIFTKRVITPYRVITQVDTAKDALVVSLNEVGEIDFDRMVRLTNKSEETLVQELDGLIYLNPETFRWETADQYLAGNVKEKLATAEKAIAGNPRFAQNIDALKLVQPVDIEPMDIAIQLGSTWIPETVVDQFVTRIFGGVHRTISYQTSLGKWIAKIEQGDRITMRVTYGTDDIPANQLVECILTNKPIQVKDTIGHDERNNPIYKLNEGKTAAANQKADEIKQAFLDWVWENKERRTMLARVYNDRFNTNIPASYDGSHLTLPEASINTSLRPHQKDAVWRAVQDGTALFDHVVGAGKTFICVASAMESKRMGLMQKPMFVVPNHLLLQWKDHFYTLYPNANILVADKLDFKKENRQKLFAKIATGDWDAVIVAHSSFKKIGMPQKILGEILNEQINDLTVAARELKEKKGDRMTIKELEKTRDRMQTKLEKAVNTGTKDNVVTFSELGVDALFVDEAHEFKNLFITTSMNRISGLGNLAGSDKAFDLFVKARYIQQKNEGRGVFFATGTPISNTIAELYTMQRYMQYDEIKKRGIVHFDAWASTFGSIVTGWELDATGVNYRLNSRFAKFQNVPELVGLYRTFADVITKTDLDRQAQEQGKQSPVPRIKGGKPLNVIVERSQEQAQYMGIQVNVLNEDGKPLLRSDGSLVKKWSDGSIIHRMENLPDNPSIDNPLKITNDARKVGLDYRLIDPYADDFEGSKVNHAVDDIYKTWKLWEARSGTQLVFCDLSTPKGAKTMIAPTPQPEHDQDNENEEDEAVTLSMDEILAGNGKFSVYDDLKAKLINRGIPEHEIRFIHDAKTDLQKSKLFDQMNRGEIRILIGSTAKMGAGMNVQQKLVALRHLDAPWRPSDLEQREGRILRQGNKFYEEDPDGFEVEITRYATKQTYDSRMWQTIEYKARGIEQFRQGDSLQRVIEDISSEAANAAEMKAAATGNTLIFMQVQLSAELKKLEALHANHKRNIHNLENRVTWLTETERRANTAIAKIQKDVNTRDINTNKEWRFEINGRRYGHEEKEQLTGLLFESMKKAIKYQATTTGFDQSHQVGNYRGFDVSVYAHRDEIQFLLKGTQTYLPINLKYTANDKFNVNGFVQRLDNFMSQFEERIVGIETTRSNELIEFEKAKVELQKPFPQQQMLELLRKDTSDVLVELRKMQNDADYVSDWQPASRKTETSQKPEDINAKLVAEGYEVVSTNRDTGIYTGKVVAMNDRFIVQNIGMQHAVFHTRDDLLFSPHEVKIDNSIHVRYCSGRGTVKSPESACARER